jgi:hypothetical protein
MQHDALDLVDSLDTDMASVVVTDVSNSNSNSSKPPKRQPAPNAVGPALCD